MLGWGKCCTSLESTVWQGRSACASGHPEYTVELIRVSVSRLASGKSGTQAITFQLKREQIEKEQVERELVELSGIEPLASSLRTRRSPS